MLDSKQRYNVTKVKRYARGINAIYVERGDAKSYYLYNAHGDVVQLTDAAGTVTQEYEYDAFGNEQSPSANDTNTLRYCGEYFDAETGTIYLRARYYDPRIGRFTASDPAGSGLNWYTYCGNNPIAFIDPSGLVMMDTMTMLDEIGIAGVDKGNYILADIDSIWYLFGYRMDSADFAKQIGLDNRFGSFNSDITENRALLYLRSEYANMQLQRALNHEDANFALDPEKNEYLLAFKKWTIQMQLEPEAMHVNVAKYDGGALSLDYDKRLELASWLKEVYYAHYNTEFNVNTYAVSEELWAHAKAYQMYYAIPFIADHARNADIGTVNKELWHERVLWDMIGGGRYAWDTAWGYNR